MSVSIDDEAKVMDVRIRNKTKFKNMMSSSQTWKLYRNLRFETREREREREREERERERERERKKKKKPE